MKIISDLKNKCSCCYGEITLLGMIKAMFSDGASANVLYRISQFFSVLKLGIIGFIFSDINKVLNGCVISSKAVFGKGFVLMHPIGVVINGGVKGGENVVIESGVVIGALRNGLPVEVPVIGNNVFIGAGAKVLGGIKIGNNVKIGANAVVVKDVCDGATVVGIPGRIIDLKG